MEKTRRARLESAIREELTTLIPRELKDPRVDSITITGVSVTQDAGMATINVMLFGTMGDDSPETRERMRLCLDGLNSAAPYLKRLLSRILRIKQTPDLTFKEDRGLANTLRVHELLKQIEDEQKD